MTAFHYSIESALETASANLVAGDPGCPDCRGAGAWISLSQVTSSQLKAQGKIEGGFVSGPMGTRIPVVVRESRFLEDRIIVADCSCVTIRQIMEG